MYFLYLDDSGSVPNQHEDYFVLAGVSLPENTVRWLAYQLEELAERIYPDDPRMVEFHASEIFGGRGHIWGQMQREHRVQTMMNVFGCLDEAHENVRLFACAVHKDSFAQEDPVKLAFEEVSSRFDMYLQRLSSEYRQERGLIVLDKSSYENSLQSLARRFNEEGNRWGNQLRTICEVPLFVDSKASRIVQLADHIAHAVFRRYDQGDINYFNRIQGRFDEHGGTIHGLIHRQTYLRECRCPACLSRR